MNILIVSGSQREASMSFEVAQYIQRNIIEEFGELSSTILDLSHYPFLLDHYGAGREEKIALANEKEAVLKQMYKCDAIIFIAPEWGGMIPPALVNLFLLSANGSAGGLPFGHKPAFAVGISASGGGANPVSLMKAYTAKNSHLVWLPLHAIIQNVNDFVIADWQPTLENRFSQIQSRLFVGIKSLIIYANQLSNVREELVGLSKTHPFGQ